MHCDSERERGRGGGREGERGEGEKEREHKEKRRVVYHCVSFHAIINCYIAQSPASSVSPSFAQYADTWDNRILTWAYKESDKLTYNQDTEGKRKRLKRKRQREIKENESDEGEERERRRFNLISSLIKRIQYFIFLTHFAYEAFLRAIL